MDGILEFIQSPVGQIVIVIAVALLFGKNPQILDWILTILKIQKPVVSPVERSQSVKLAQIDDTDNPDDKEPDREDAFVAANILLEYYGNLEEGGNKEGLEAAKKCGQCLFM